MRYSWAPGCHLKVDPQKIGEEFSRIEKEKGGEVQARDLVEFAKNNPDSHLYQCFTHDVHEAAYKYWLVEARYVIRHLKIEYVRPDATIQVRRSYHIQGAYRNTEAVFKDRDLREELVKTIFKRLMSIREEYAHVSELADVFSDIDVRYNEWAKKLRKGG